MTTFKNPPMYPTSVTPQEIIDVANMRLFEEHYAIASRSTNQGEFPDKELNKKIGPEDRQHVANVLARLREFGFYPRGYNERGGINWCVVLKSELQVLFESRLNEFEQMSQEKLMEMGRSGYLAIVEKTKVEPARDYDLNHLSEYDSVTNYSETI